MNNSDFFNDLSSDEELFNAYEHSDVDIKFRSVRVESHQGGDYFSAYHQQSNSFSMPLAGQIFKSNTTSKSSSSSSSGCPSAPFGIAKTNFIINKPDYTTVVRSITENLNGHDNFDFSFVESEHMVIFDFRFLYVHSVASCCTSFCNKFLLCLLFLPSIVERQVPLWLKLL